MGVMRFIVHPTEVLDDWPEALRAYVTAADGRIFPTRCEIEDGMLAVRRQQPDSGKLNVVWPVPGYGRPMVSTSSLRETETPYLLPLELARGKITRVRDQVGAWEIAGMALPDEFVAAHHRAHHLFAQAVGLRDTPEEASRVALEALRSAFDAAESLVRSYTEQRLAVRRRRSARLPASLGCGLGRELPQPDWNEHFVSAFNAATVPIQWRDVEPEEGRYEWDVFDAQVEWCQANRLLTYGGPLLDFSPGGLPEWIAPWRNDPLNLQSFISDFVETALSRYLGRIRHWEVSAYGNLGGGLGLNEEQRLTLVAKTLETARRIDDEVQLTVRVDQPWGDYQQRGQHRLSPLQFVDALLRSGVGLSGVNLEFGVGCEGAGTASRDLLDVSQLVDRWSVLGIPLHVTLAFPTARGDDPAVEGDVQVGPQCWKRDFCPDAQAEWVDLYVPLLMAKQAVVGMFWTHYSDAAPHRYPHAGLVDAAGRPKPALTQLARYNAEYWQS